MQSVVVTGVSTGIGWGITKVLIQRGFRVFGSVRKTQDAERLSKEFGERFAPLLFDVTDEAAVQAGARQLREQLNGETLFGLVNNAGIAVPAPLIHQSTDEFRNQHHCSVLDHPIELRPGKLHALVADALDWHPVLEELLDERFESDRVVCGVMVNRRVLLRLRSIFDGVFRDHIFPF